MAEKGNGFSAEERAALKQRSAELRAGSRQEKAAEKREREAQACREAIAGLTGVDREAAELLDKVVREVAPQLEAKTWYGFPAYAREGKTIVFYQFAAKFKTRYGHVGFSEDARLDDGAIWPVAFAVVAVNAEVEKQLRELVRRAA